MKKRTLNELRQVKTFGYVNPKVTNVETEIVEKELWDHYSELPNPAWYDYKNKENDMVKIEVGVADANNRAHNITRKEGEWYNAKCTDSYGNEYQNWYETAKEAHDWILYVWEKEDWFNSIDSQELLYKAIQECGEIDKEKGIGTNN